MINEECIACDACREECPNEAIEEEILITQLTQKNAQNVMDSMMSLRVYLFAQ